jgi:hypothetical protein
MSLDIVSRTIGGELDKKFVLRNHQCARIMSFQSTWTRLRIGTRLAIEDTGGNISGTPRFYMGLLASPSAGLDNGPLSVATSHFVGVRQDGAAITRNAGPPINYGTTIVAVTKVGTTVGGSLSLGTAIISGTPATSRYAWVVEFLKGSPNWTVTSLGLGNSASGIDVPYDAMVQAMEADTMAGAEAVLDAYGTYTDTATGSLPVNEATNGFVNAVCFAWDRSTVDLEWSELLFSKFA